MYITSSNSNQTSINRFPSYQNPPSRPKREKQSSQISDEAIEDTKEKFKVKDLSYVSVETLDEAAIALKIRQLKQWQDHVISHEQAHMMVGGGMVGSPSYTYTYGPDGKKYITGGEVTFYIPVGATMETGIEALKKLKAAATASSDASPADLKAAALAGALEASVHKTLMLRQAREAYEKWRMNHVESMEKSGDYVSPISKFKFSETRVFQLFI